MRRSLALVPVVAALGLAGVPATAQTPGIFTDGKIVVSLSGVGKVRFGMTPAQVRTAAGIYLRSERRGACRYLVDGPPGGRRRTDFRLENKRLVTVSVHQKAYRTPKRVGTGTRLARLKAAYTGMRTKRAIGGGTNHIYKPSGSSKRRFVFLVAGGKVESFRSGPAPAVFLEECY